MVLLSLVIRIHRNMIPAAISCNSDIYLHHSQVSRLTIPPIIDQRSAIDTLEAPILCPLVTDSVV